MQNGELSKMSPQTSALEGIVANITQVLRGLRDPAASETTKPSTEGAEWNDELTDKDPAEWNDELTDNDPAKPPLGITQTQSHEPGRYAILLFTANFLNGIIISMIGPCAYFLKADVGVSDSDIGLSVFTRGICKILGVTTFGYLARTDTRQMWAAVVFSFLGLAVGTFMLAAARSAGVMYAGFAVQGLAYGLLDAAFTVTIAWIWLDPRDARFMLAAAGAVQCLGATAFPAFLAGISSIMSDSQTLGCSALLPILIAMVLVLMSALTPRPTSYDETQDKIDTEEIKDDQYNVLGTGVLSHQELSDQEVPHQEGGMASDQEDGMASDQEDGMASDQEGGIASQQVTDTRWLVSFLCCIYFCLQGCEHGLAMGIAVYADEKVQIGPEQAALFASTFWCSFVVGRIFVAGFGYVINNGWYLFLIYVVGCFLTSGLALILQDDVQRLWVLTIPFPLFVSGFYVIGFTLPLEAGLPVTSVHLTAIMIAGSLGELLYPLVFGILFDAGLFGTMPLIVGASSTAALLVFALAFYRTQAGTIHEVNVC